MKQREKRRAHRGAEYCRFLPNRLKESAQTLGFKQALVSAQRLLVVKGGEGAEGLAPGYL